MRLKSRQSRHEEKEKHLGVLVLEAPNTGDGWFRFGLPVIATILTAL